MEGGGCGAGGLHETIVYGSIQAGLKLSVDDASLLQSALHAIISVTAGSSGTFVSQVSLQHADVGGGAGGGGNNAHMCTHNSNMIDYIYRKTQTAHCPDNKCIISMESGMVI